jgi:3-methylfumaryl-CoA hydratase
VYRLAGPSGPGAHAAEGGAGEGATGSAAGGAAARASTAADLPEPAWREPFVADEVTLFRFSALTFNGHRIHYDHPYATGVEGYPGLVVHGPLLALLLLDAGVRRLPGGGAALGAKLLSFRYRAVGPAFCSEPLRLEGLPDAGSLRVVHAERGVLMEAALTSTT